MALLAVASLQAPFAHVHTGEPDHHAAGFVHAHLELAHAHESEEAEIEAPDDDDAAINVDWAPTEAKRVTVSYAELLVSPAWQPIPVRLGSAPEFRARSHSPPQQRLSPARAPPV